MDELSAVPSSLWEKIWTFFAQWGLVGIALASSLAANLVQTRIIWECIQFMKKLAGKDNVEKS